MGNPIFVDLDDRKLVDGLQELIDKLFEERRAGEKPPLLGRLDPPEHARQGGNYNPLVMVAAGYLSDRPGMFGLSFTFYTSSPPWRLFAFSFEPHVRIEVVGSRHGCQVLIPVEYVENGGTLTITEIRNNTCRV